MATTANVKLPVIKFSTGITKIQAANVDVKLPVLTMGAGVALPPPPPAATVNISLPVIDVAAGVTVAAQDSAIGELVLSGYGTITTPSYAAGRLILSGVAYDQYVPPKYFVLRGYASEAVGTARGALVLRCVGYDTPTPISKIILTSQAASRPINKDTASGELVIRSVARGSAISMDAARGELQISGYASAVSNGGTARGTLILTGIGRDSRAAVLDAANSALILRSRMNAASTYTDTASGTIVLRMTARGVFVDTISGGVVLRGHATSKNIPKDVYTGAIKLTGVLVGGNATVYADTAASVITLVTIPQAVTYVWDVPTKSYAVNNATFAVTELTLAGVVIGEYVLQNGELRRLTYDVSVRVNFGTWGLTSGTMARKCMQSMYATFVGGVVDAPHMVLGADGVVRKYVCQTSRNGTQTTTKANLGRGVIGNTHTFGLEFTATKKVYMTGLTAVGYVQDRVI